MRGVPGTSCRITYDYRAPHHPEFDPPVEGDFLRTEAGSCYLIDEVRRSPKYPTTRVILTCTRLEPDAVQHGQEGVWSLYWHRRERSRV